MPMRRRCRYCRVLRAASATRRRASPRSATARRRPLALRKARGDATRPPPRRSRRYRPSPRARRLRLQLQLQLPGRTHRKWTRRGNRESGTSRRRSGGWRAARRPTRMNSQSPNARTRALARNTRLLVRVWCSYTLQHIFGGHIFGNYTVRSIAYR